MSVSDTSTWTKNTWISLHGLLLFTIIANIICLYYFRQIYKRVNNNTTLQKHLNIRHKHLFIAHLIIDWYWVTIHPIINFILVIFKVKYSIGYCYGYLMYSVMIVCWGSRMWFLYWDYSFSQLQVKMIWRKQMDNRYTSWFLSHLKYGKIRNVIVFCIFLLLITNTSIALLAWYTNFSNIVHWLASSIVASLVIVLTTLCIQLHNKHNLDHYNIRKEFTYQYLIYVIISISAIIPYLTINNTFVRLCIVSDSVTIACFCTIIVSIKIILNDCQVQSSEYLNTKQQNNNATITLIECLQHPTGINTFAEWLCGEICVESLLFVIEVCQYRKFLKKYICEHYPEHIFDDVASMYFEVANNLPLSSIIQSCKIKQTKLKDITTNSTKSKHSVASFSMFDDMATERSYDVPIPERSPSLPSLSAKKMTSLKGFKISSKSFQIIYNYNKIAIGIKDKFIKDMYGELTVNISGEERMRLCEFNYLDCEHIELYSVFDEAFIQVLRILKQPFQRFSISINFKRLVKVLRIQSNKPSSPRERNCSTNNANSIILCLNDNGNTLSQSPNEKENDCDVNDSVDKTIHSVLYRMSHLMNNHCLKCC